jgi:hypothetical protein
MGEVRVLTEATSSAGSVVMGEVRVLTEATHRMGAL